MTTPRIRPGGLRDLGPVNRLLTAVLARGAGVSEAHLFTTLGRHRRLFRVWLLYSGALMLGGRLPRRQTELVILRVAHRCASEYERRHHERLGARAGLTPAELAAVRTDEARWAPREAALLQATDELLARGDLEDTTWARLRAHWDERQVIEWSLLVGQYRGLAETIRVLRIAPDR